MRNTIIAGLILIILISTTSLSATPSSEKEPGYASVLIYHKFDRPDSPSTSVSSTLFKEHLVFLKNNGYRVVSLEELLSMINSKTGIPPKTVAITIDDGYKSTYNVAYPILKEFGYPFTVFLYMEGVARYPDFLTKAQLDDMKKDPLVTFGNHSYSHHRFARESGEEIGKDHLKAFTEDLSKAENRFSKLIGHKPYIYSYPYGEYNTLMMKHLKDNHYIGAFTQDAGNVSVSADPFMIPRIPIVGGWAEMKKFREFLETEPINVLNTTPAPGILPSAEVDSIVIQLKDIESYSNLGIYISEKGWLAAEVNNPSGKVTLKGPIYLTRKVNRIGLTGVNRQSGRRASFFYMVILP